METGGISLVDVTFRWKIREIFSLTDKSSFVRRSPSFLFGKNSWNLEMRRYFGLKWLDIRLESESTTTVDYEIYLEKINGEKFEEFTIENRASERPSSPDSLSVTPEELRDAEKDLVQSGTLTVVCHIKESKSSPMDETPASEELLRLDALSSDFRNFFTSKEASDVCLRVQNREFHVHRAILTARSSVFAGMFKSDTSRKESGFVVTIPDCDPETFGEFLKYLYTGRVKKVSFEEARHLYVTGYKYGVEELSNFCVTSMEQGLAVENVCDVAILADMYKNKHLSYSCHTFFSEKENFLKIASTAGWFNLLRTKHHLAGEILDKITEKRKYYAMFNYKWYVNND